MDSKFVLLVGLFVILPSVDCSRADLKVNNGEKVNASANIGLDPKIALTRYETNGSNEKSSGGSNLVLNTTKVNKVKDEEDQLGGSKEGVVIENGIDRSNSSGQSELREADNVQKGVDGSSEESKGKEGHDEKEKLRDGMRSKDGVKEEGNEGNVVSSTPLRNEGSRGEECDSSNMCTDEKNKLVACLRVPGNDSPDLLLLIQNKGKGPLVVTISAPDSVQLEERKVQIQEKEDTKVKVSIIDGGTDSLITLTAGSGNCSLDFRDLIGHTLQKEFENPPKSSFISFLKRKPVTALIFFAPLVILLSAWMCINLRRRYYSGSGFKFQQIDMGLPVSSGGKTELDTNDGWDNSWGDSWDDEEAPKTPSMPVTPGLSSKGLASRRWNKEGRKD